MLGPDEYDLRLFVENVCRLAGGEPLLGLDDLQMVDDQERYCSTV
jgi:hypothetical protein